MCSILACLDGYMNIAMEQTEEYVNGQLKNKYSIAFILGNDGTLKDDSLFYCYYSNFLFLPHINDWVISFHAVLYVSPSKRTLADRT